MNFLERANLSITFIFAYVMLLGTSYSDQGLPTGYLETFWQLFVFRANFLC